LCIGVGSFRANDADEDEDEEPGLDRFDDLAFAPGYAADLHSALTAADYSGELVTDRGLLAADDLAGGCGMLVSPGIGCCGVAPTAGLRRPAGV
jgi:hypothetical protein